MFFVGTSGGPGRGLLAALLLTGVILLGVFLTFGVSRLLSGTLLRGVPSSFTLELPPYRRPRIGQVVVRSVLDRTLFVLGRAAAVAAPAGLLIWLCANVQVGGDSILNWCTGFLDPFARLLGLDGVILMAFLLGFPANEIVIPIIIMAYLSTGSLLEFDSLDALRQLLVDHGWTWLTAVCTMLFSLMHWPCSTTCLTIGKETKSAKWTLLSIAIPTGIGMAVCFLVASAARLLGLDGVILMAFLLGFPANEIVIPIIIMAYLSTGSLLEFDSLDALRQLLVDHGWTWLTAVCTMLFSLMHWPCSTTCLTIGKETKSAKWTLLSIAIPTGIGMAVCFLVASAARLLGLA